MANTYTYTFLAKDLMSSKLSKIASTGKSLGGQLKDAYNNADASIKKTEGSVNSLGKIATKWFTAFASYKTFTFIKDLGFDAETTRIKYEALLGSASAAEGFLKGISNIKSPFNKAELESNAEQLLKYGVNGNKVIPVLKMLGDVSVGDKGKLNSLSLAFGQISTKGKLMREDLNQMIHSGFNPLQIISEKTGIKMSALENDMKKGKLGINFVEEALKIATSEGGKFHGMMDKLSSTGASKFSAFFDNLKSKIGGWSETNLVPVLKKVIEFGTEFVNGFSVVGEAVSNLLAPLQPLWNAVTNLISLVFGWSSSTFTAANALTTLTNIINFLAVPIEIFITGITQIVKWLTPLAPIIKWVAIAYGVLTAAQWLLNIAMTANPIGLIIAGLAALVGGIIYAYEKIGWFRGSIMAIWETMKGFGNAIKEYVVDRIKQMLAGITGIGGALMSFFKGDWKKAWETGKEAVANLTGIGVGNGSKFINNMKDAGKNAGIAYNKGVAEAEANKKKKSIFDSIKTDAAPDGGGTATPIGGLAEGLGQGIDNITGGGSRQTNITVNLQSLVENYTVQTQTFEQGADESLDTLKKMLLRVLNSANQMQTSPA